MDSSWVVPIATRNEDDREIPRSCSHLLSTIIPPIHGCMPLYAPSARSAPLPPTTRGKHATSNQNCHVNTQNKKDSTLGALHPCSDKIRSGEGYTISEAIPCCCRPGPTATTTHSPRAHQQAHPSRSLSMWMLMGSSKSPLNSSDSSWARAFRAITGQAVSTARGFCTGC